MKNICKDILMIMAGAFLIAASVEFFVIPNHLGDGDTVGIALVLYYLFHIPASITTLVVNLIFIGLAYKFLTKKNDFIHDTRYGNDFCFSQYRQLYSIRRARYGARDCIRRSADGSGAGIDLYC